MRTGLELGFIRTGLGCPLGAQSKPTPKAKPDHAPSPEPSHAPHPAPDHAPSLQQGSAVESPAMVEGRKATMSVGAMKKLQERWRERERERAKWVARWIA